MFNEFAAQTPQPDSLEYLFSCAFHHEPRVTYVLPDEAARRKALPMFFRSLVIPATRICGEIHTTPQIEGGSLWIRPGLFSALVSIVRTKVRSLELKLEPSSLIRWANLTATMEKTHRRLAKGPHWYLLALGIQASRMVDKESACKADTPQPSRDDISGALVDPVLARADRDRRACYVESFDETRLSFYEGRGFQIAGAGKFPNGGPNFWAMIRRPSSIPIESKCGLDPRWSRPRYSRSHFVNT
jgi:hypothetical protein